jgi:hypothetical protein
MFLAAERVLKERTTRYADMGLSYFTPGKPDPILSITFDEAPMILTGDDKLAQKIAKIAANIGKAGRSVGIKLRLCAQVPNLSEIGGDQALREMLQTGNIILLRTGSKNSTRIGLGNLADDLDTNNIPKTWPDGSRTQGLGYLIGAQEKNAPYRSVFVDDSENGNIRDWIAAGKLTVLEEGSLDAAGEAYANRHDPHTVTAPAAAATDPAPAVDFGKREEVTLLHGTSAGGRVGSEQILQLLEEDGLLATTVIADRLGAKTGTIRQAMNRLRQQGKVHSPSKGLWQLAETVDDHELEPAL